MDRCTGTDSPPCSWPNATACLPEPELRDALNKAVKLIADTQNNDGGWRYLPQREDADISVTACQVMALRRPQRRHLRAPRRDRPLDQLYQAEPEPGRRFHVQDSRRRKRAFPRSAAAVAALYSAGIYEGAEITKGLDYLMEFIPAEASVRRENYFYYAHYYAAQAMWQSGGKRFARWFPAARDELVAKQQEDGSWIAPAEGNECATAMACIVLQIPNNYLPIFSKALDRIIIYPPVNTPRALATILIYFTQSENMEISGTPNTKRAIARNLQLAICNLQFAFILLFLILSLFSPQFLYAVPIAVPVEGRPFVAQPASIDATGRIVFQAAEKRQLPLRDLVAWGACPEAKRAPVLVLAVGGLLPADVLSSDKETLSADSELFGRLKIPWDRMAGIVFRLPPACKDRDALFDRISRAEGESDRLLLDNGDELSGLLENITADAIKFKTSVATADIELARVASIVFNPALRRKMPVDAARCWLGFSDGTRLPATNVLLDPSALQLSVFGQTWTTAPSIWSFIQPTNGRAVYLSDLTPGDYRFVPYLDLTWPYRLDRAVAGTWLRSGGVLYLKGIGMHSAARLTYNLDQPYKSFQAELAIDDSASGGGSVRFRVFVDGQEKFTSETIRGGMKPMPINVDLPGAKQLDLVVDYADRADVLDRADWLNARLIK